MEIPLKYKYRAWKFVKHTGHHGDHQGQNRHKVAGKKTYVYGSRVLLVDMRNGRAPVMVSGESIGWQK